MLKILIAMKSQTREPRNTRDRFTNDKFLMVSVGIAAIKSDGKMKVKRNLIPPWNAPPWKSVGVKNNWNTLSVIELASVK